LQLSGGGGGFGGWENASRIMKNVLQKKNREQSFSAKRGNRMKMACGTKM